MFAAVFRKWSFTEDPKEINCQNNQQSCQPQKDDSFPSDLPGRILDLQLKCEGQDVDEALVFQLVDAYRTAIEHFQQLSDRRYKMYEKRMKNFLSKPLIRHILRGQNKQLLIKREINAQIVREAQKKAEKQVREYIMIQQQKQEKQKSLIHKQLSKQNDRLEDRIRSKKVKSNISTRSRNSLPNEESTQKQISNIIDKKLILKGIQERGRILRKVYF